MIMTTIVVRFNKEPDGEKFVATAQRSDGNEAFMAFADKPEDAVKKVVAEFCEMYFEEL